MTANLMKDVRLMKEWSKEYPIGRFGKPEDVANACLYLASDESSFVTGTVLPVDGGFTAHWATLDAHLGKWLNQIHIKKIDSRWWNMKL